MKPILLTLLLLASPGHASSKPNILVILADDLGWRDLGFTGNEEIRTPHLDRLAAAGMRFTDAHSAAPICSPSRAALLTGRSPARLQYEFVPKFASGRPEGPQPLQPPNFPTELPADMPTVATALRDAGYATAFCGKWHLNRHQGHYLGWRPGHGPESFGFDHTVDDFGAHPYGYKKNGPPPPPVKGDAFPDDALTDGAIEFIRRDHQRPFLLWMSFYHVHDPFHSRCIDRVAYHQSRLPAGASPKRAHYAAMVETLDHEVGRLLDALDASGKTDDTLVIFTSDNGGHPEVSANGPLRGSKWNLYQGGIRVPLAIRWPGKIKPASTCAEPVIAMDLAASLLDVAGLLQDSAPDGRSMLALFSGKKEFAWQTRPMMWHFPFYQPETGYNATRPDIGVNDFAIARSQPHSAIRIGDLKLIHFFESATDEFYDLAADPSESQNLASDRPEETAKLHRELFDLLESSNARIPARKP